MSQSYVSNRDVLAELACEQMGHELELYTSGWNQVDLKVEWSIFDVPPSDFAYWSCLCGKARSPAPLEMSYDDLLAGPLA